MNLAEHVEEQEGLCINVLVLVGISGISIPEIYDIQMNYFFLIM